MSVWTAYESLTAGRFGVRSAFLAAPAAPLGSLLLLTGPWMLSGL